MNVKLTWFENEYDNESSHSLLINDNKKLEIARIRFCKGMRWEKGPDGFKRSVDDSLLDSWTAQILQEGEDPVDPVYEKRGLPSAAIAAAWVEKILQGEISK